MNKRPLAAIVLAAGQGTRMKSAKHKVLHMIAGKSMLDHLLDAIDEVGVKRTVLVVGAMREQIERSAAHRQVTFTVQQQQLGTGHAVLQAKEALAGFTGNILACFGDVPMVQPETVQAMIDKLDSDPQIACVVLAFRPEDAKAYGRVIADDGGMISKMVEHKDATAAEREVNLCNSGLLLARSEEMFDLLEKIGNDNAQGEYYLPDLVTVALAQGRSCAAIECPEWQVAGINSRAELAAVSEAWQQRKRQQMMADGVSLIAPDSVWFAHDTQIAPDVTIEPNVIFGPGVSVATGATIYGHSHIVGATIGPDATVGPFARLRPGAVLEAGAKIGNFVEMKNATLGKGAKASHLTYLGDAEVGEGANIGAGTITCNYDGYFKYKTIIGKGAFIGSNSALVAPVNIGDGAIVGAGATITRDVAADDLALVRADQTGKSGWAGKFRATMQSRKDKLK